MSDRCFPAGPIEWPPRPGDDRASRLRHLAACDACRVRWAADEPSRLFALLALDRPADEAWDAALDAVSANVRRDLSRMPIEAFRRRSGSGRASRVAGWVAIAAGVLLAAVVVWRAPRPSAPERSAPVAVVESAGLPLDGLAGVEWISVDERAAERIDFRVGDTQVTMILDKGLEL